MSQSVGPAAPASREPLRVLLRRYALPVCVTTVVLVALGVLVGSSPWLTAALVLAAAPLAACVVIDARTHRIPTPLVRMIAMVGMLTFGAEALSTGMRGGLLRAVVAAAAVGGGFLALWWCTRGGTGLGDVRLAAALALIAGWVEWRAVVGFVVAAYFLAFPVALLRLARGRRDPMPFGPALVAGWYVTLGAIAWSGP